MNSMPQELIADIISFVPEYGFMVCKSLHHDLRDSLYSFYCDHQRFALIHNIEFDPLAISIQCFEIAEYTYKDGRYKFNIDYLKHHDMPELADAVSEVDSHWSSPTDEYEDVAWTNVIESDSENTNVSCDNATTVPKKIVANELDDFEPWVWSKALLQDRLQDLFLKVLTTELQIEWYDYIAPQKFKGHLYFNYNNKQVFPKEVTKAANECLIKLNQSLMLHTNGFISAEIARQQVLTIIDGSNVPDMLYVIGAICDHSTNVMLGNMLYGPTTMAITRDIIKEHQTKYRNVNSRQLKFLMTYYGHQMVDQDDIKEFDDLYSHYLLVTLMHKPEDKTKEELIGIIEQYKRYHLRCYD